MEVLGKDVLQGSRRKVCSISKSRKTKNRKVERCLCEFRKSKSWKVYFLTFHFLTVWIFAGCLSSWTYPAKSTKLKPLRVEREEEKPKSRKGEREEEKSKSQKVYFLTFHFLNFCRMPFQPNMRSSFFQLRDPQVTIAFNTKMVYPIHNIYIYTCNFEWFGLMTSETSKWVCLKI